MTITTLPQLVAAESIVVEAKEEKQVITPASDEIVYDKYWITQLSILSLSPNEEAKMVAVMSPLTDDKDLWVDGDVKGEKRMHVVVSDIFSKANSDPKVSEALATLHNLVIEQGKASSLLK